MAQIGSIFFILWGVLHLYAARLVYKLGARQPAGMVRGRIYQSAWNLAFFAVAVVVVALVAGWNNSPLGYWLNAIMTAVTDVGFIVFVLIPGYLPLRPGLLGPALWIVARAFSTWAQFGPRL
ncbi:MAG: hypothetical protein ABI847_21150 [Anaerolineales bacterium]